MQPDQTPFSNAVEINELPHHLDCSFDWLGDTPLHAEWAIGDRSGELLDGQLKSAIKSASVHAIQLPTEFVEFLRNPLLHKHVRSASGCYLDVANTVIPLDDGYLLRFLNDQQGCAFWYIYMNTDASDHCVVCSYEYHDLDDGDYELDEITASDFHICESSFERFVSRFWIENEIMFAQYDETPPPDIPKKYLDLYAQ